MATQQQINAIVSLYAGYFDRAPDPIGLQFWINQIDNGRAFNTIAADFAAGFEARGLYPFLVSPGTTDPTSFVVSVYNNLFNRGPDAEGLTFWVNVIKAGTVPVGDMIQRIIDGAKDAPSASPPTFDLLIMANKQTVGLDFAAKAAAKTGFTFDAAAAAAAKSAMDGITSDPASVTKGLADNAAFFGSTGSPGNTIFLTSNTDQPGGGGNGANTQGTSGDDTYSATFETNTGTLQSSDNIAAGAGSDTLNIRVISTGGTTATVSPVATDLEKVVITNQDATSGIFRLDFNSITGETEVTTQQNASNATTLVSNVDMGTTLGMKEVKGLFFANFKGDTSGSADAITLNVENSGSVTDFARFLTTDATANTIDKNFEAITVDAAGTTGSFIDLFGMTLQTITVTGSQALSLEDVSGQFAGLKSVDASAMTGGGLTIDANATTEADLSFKGSGQSDRLVLSNTIFNTSSTLNLDGGNGTDTIVVDSFSNLSATSVNKATNFEVLEAKNATSSLNASDFTQINTFVFAGQSSNGSRTNINGVTGNDTFVFATDVGQSDETIRFSADTAGQSLKFELRANAATNGEVRILADSNSGNDTAAVGFGNSNISSVQIVSSGTNTNANVIRAVDTGSNNYYAFDNQGGPNNFSISGSQALTITAEVGVALTASSDERGFHSGVNLDGSNASGALRIAGSGSSDTLQGGSGNDILYGLGGNDVLTGNNGTDQFRFSDWNGTDKIQDFASGVDKVGLNRFDFGNTNESSSGTTLNSSDYVQNLQVIANISNAENHRVVELQSGASSNQITQTTTAAVEAYVLVFNQTTGKGELWYDNDWSTTSSRSQTAEFTNITELAQLTGLTNTDFVEYTF